MQPCVLGGGEHASERVKRRRYERLLETTRFEVFTPGLAAREQERSGAARTRHWLLPGEFAGDSRPDLRIHWSSSSAGFFRHEPSEKAHFPVVVSALRVHGND